MKFFTFLLFGVFTLALILVSITISTSTTAEYKDTVIINDSPAILSAVSITKVESAILEQINISRSKLGLFPLSSNGDLQDIAIFRSTDMSTKQYYAHTSLNGIGFKDLVEKGSGFACENLLLTESVEATKVVQDWMNSPSHRSCILSEKIKIAGISTQKFDSSENSELSSMVVTFIGSER